MAKKGNRQQEVGFCARVKAWSDEFFANTPDIDLARAEIEEYVSGGLKRYDLRFYTRNDEIELCGEVKLPGTPQGQ